MADAWQTLIAQFAVHVRDMRTLVGLSQQQLAVRADTSQGAISRLEAGSHIDVPLLTILKVTSALADATAQVDGAIPRQIAALLGFAAQFPHTHGGPLPDPALTQLLTAYHRLATPRRQAFVQLVLPLAHYLAAVVWAPSATEVPPGLEDDPD